MDMDMDMGMDIDINTDLDLDIDMGMDIEDMKSLCIARADPGFTWEGAGPPYKCSG